VIDELISMDARERMVPVDAPALREAVARLLAGERELPALRQAGVGLVALGEHTRAQAVLVEALAAAEAGGDAGAEVRVRLDLADAHRYAGRLAPAESLCRRALEIARTRCPELVDFALQHLGKCRIDQGGYAEAVDRLWEALALRQAKGDPSLVAATRRALRLAVVARLRAAGCVYAEDEARLLLDPPPADLTARVDRRVAGEPIEHVLGWAEFCGLRIAVDPGVFVPRRRTGLLLREAVRLARPAAGRPAVVVDLCCGSGAVGAALAAALDRIELYSVDVDPAAVRCARRNLDPAGGRVFEGDLFAPLPASLRGRAGVLVASPPYVPTGEVGLLPAEARTHEPRSALDGGADGLEIVRRVCSGARSWLAPGGHLLVETSARQAPSALDAVVRGGMVPRVSRSEDLDATVVAGTLPAPTG
jgi:release factor glutamine methyltransferase